MPIKLSEVKTIRETYHEQVAKEISKLKDGYGISLSEMAEKLKLSERQFRSYKFPKVFNTTKINSELYFIK